MNMENICSLIILAPKGLGKTSIVEAMLFNAGLTTRIGKIEDGNTASDFDSEEIERKMSIFPSIISFEWKSNRISIVDTAGYPDFIGETKECMRAVDNALMMVSAVSGVKSQASKMWQLLNESSMPRMIFLNEMDKEFASFENSWESLKKVLNGSFVPITLPLFENEKFCGVIDLIKMQAYCYESVDKYSEIDIPDEHQKMAKDYKEKLVESVAEVDDAVLENYLETGELSDKDLEKGLKMGIGQAKIIPVFSGSATLNIGVRSYLDYFCEFSRRPNELDVIKGTGKEQRPEERKSHPSEAFSALVFKTVADQYAGRITCFRIMSGILKPDSTILNSTKNRKEKISQIFSLCGKKQTSLPQAVAGDIVAVVKLQETSTGDTLCDVANPIILSPMKFPEPVISLAIRPKERGDEDKLSTGLAKLMDEDPLLRVKREEQTKELTISGMGQLHLEALVSRLKKKFAIDIDVSTPEIPYRETILKSAKAQGKYKKQSGGRGQYGDVWLEIEPMERGSGFEFANKIFGGAVPRNYIPAVEKGVVERMAKGVVAGYPVVDMRVTIYDGSYHDVDSSDLAFRIAGSMAIQKAFIEASPILLEPIMNVEIEIPDECMGDVIGDLNGRRGRIITVDQGKDVKIVKAEVPQAEMLKYAPDMRAITSGRGAYTMELSHFAEVPKKIAEELIARAKAKIQEEKEE